MTGTVLFPAADSTHIGAMAKGPDRLRDPAKHSQKDPAKPTRAKAARPDTSPLDPALADLLNPAIGQGRAGVGSQTGTDTERRRPVTSPQRGEVGRESDSESGQVGGIEPRDNPPSAGPMGRPPSAGQRQTENPGDRIQPAPDNSFDRRADFANAHRARASVARGFGEE